MQLTWRQTWQIFSLPDAKLQQGQALRPYQHPSEGFMERLEVSNPSSGNRDCVLQAGRGGACSSYMRRFSCISGVSVLVNLDIAVAARCEACQHTQHQLVSTSHGSRNTLLLRIFDRTPIALCTAPVLRTSFCGFFLRWLGHSDLAVSS